MGKLDFDSLMDWLKETHPYSMLRWIQKNYWIETDLENLKASEET